MIAPQVLLWGEGRGAAGPRYWQAAPVASDDGVAFGLVVETQPFAPTGLGGECAFTVAHVTTTTAAGATLKVTPILDDTAPATRTTPNSGSVSTVRPTYAVAQQTGGPPVPMMTSTIEVPLLVVLTRSGAAVSRWYPRGARCGIRIESVGAIGTGTFRIDGLEIEYQPTRPVLRGTVTT